MGLNVTLTEVGVKSFALRLAYLKSIQGIFKIVESIIAIVLISVVSCYYAAGYRANGDLFFLLMIVNFFICTVCLFISEWILWSTVDSTSKSMFEIVYFVISLILLFASSVNLFSNILSGQDYHKDIYTPYIISSVLEFALIGVYVIDIVLSLWCSGAFKKTKNEASTLNS